MRQCGLGAIHHAEEVYPYHLLPFLDRSIEDGSEEHDPGVIDQHVDSPELRSGAADADSASERWVTSASMDNTSPPIPLISSASVASRSARRATSTTVAPCRASIREDASPMPLEAPVTTATQPRRTLSLISYLVRAHPHENAARLARTPHLGAVAPAMLAPSCRQR